MNKIFKEIKLLLIAVLFITCSSLSFAEQVLRMQINTESILEGQTVPVTLQMYYDNGSFSTPYGVTAIDVRFKVSGATIKNPIYSDNVKTIENSSDTAVTNNIVRFSVNSDYSKPNILFGNLTNKEWIDIATVELTPTGLAGTTVTITNLKDSESDNSWTDADGTYYDKGIEVATDVLTLTVINKFTAVADTGVVLEDAVATEFDVLVNDVDMDGTTPAREKRIKADSVSIDLVNSKNEKGGVEDSAAKIGAAVIANGKINFTPAKDWNGIAVIKYTAEYNDAGTWAAATETTLTVTVTAVNDAPEFTDTQPTVSIAVIPKSTDNTDIVIENVTTNDVDGDTVTTVYSWAISVDGTNWTPIANQTTSTLSAAGRQTAAALNLGYKIKGTVTITDSIITTPVSKEFITQVGQFVANNDTATILENALATDATTLIDVLANDNDVDGTTPARAKQIKAGSLVVDPMAAGTASIKNNKILFVPAANKNGSVTVKYIAQAGADYAIESEATLTITVTAVNSAPVITENSVTIAENPINTFTVADTVAYSDIETETVDLVITYAWKLITYNGTAAETKTVGTNANAVTLTPENLAGATVYKVTCEISVKDTGDGADVAKTATTSRSVFVGKFITTADDNTTPTAELPEVVENTGTVIDYTFDVLANDIDYDADGVVMTTPRVRTITAATIKTADNALGAVKIESGKIVFTPVLNKNGTAVIDYIASSKISDSENIESSSTLTIKITAVNTAPVLAAEKVTLTNNAGTLTISLDADAYSDIETITANLSPEYQWQILKYAATTPVTIAGKTTAAITAAEITAAALDQSADVYTISGVVVIKDDGKNEGGTVSTQGVLSSNSVTKSEKFGNLPPTISNIKVPANNEGITEGATFNFEVTVQDGDFPDYDGIDTVEWFVSNDDGTTWASAKQESVFFNPALNVAKKGDLINCKFDFITDNNTQLHNESRKFKVKVKVIDKAMPTAKSSETIYDIIVKDKNEEVVLTSTNFLTINKLAAVRAEVITNIDVNDTIVATIDLTQAKDKDIEDYDATDAEKIKSNLKYEVQWFINGATTPVTTTPVVDGETTVTLANDFTIDPKKVFFAKGNTVTAKAIVKDTAATPSEKSSEITRSITVINSAPVVDDTYTPPPFKDAIDMDGATFPVKWTEGDLTGGITDNDGDKVVIKDAVIKAVTPVAPSTTPYPGDADSLLGMTEFNDDGQGNITVDFNPGNNFDYLKDGEQAKVTVTVTVSDGQIPETSVDKDYDFIITGKNDAPVIDESKVTVNTDNIGNSNKTDSISVTVAPDAITDAEGDVIDPTYKWEISTDGGNTWTSIPANTDAELTQTERETAAGDEKVYDIRVTVTATDTAIPAAADSVSKVINVKVLELYFDTTAINLGQAKLNEQLSGYVLIKNEKTADATVKVKYAAENANFTKDIKDTDEKLVPANGVIAVKVSFKASAIAKETAILQIVDLAGNVLDNCTITAEAINLNDPAKPENAELVRVAVKPATIIKKNSDIADAKVTYDVKIEIAADATAGTPAPVIITLPKGSTINGQLPEGFNALDNVITADNSVVTETKAKTITFNVTTAVEVNKVYDIKLSETATKPTMIISHGTLAISDAIRGIDLDVNGSGKVNARDLLILYRYWNGGADLGLGLKSNDDCYPNKRKAADDNKITTEDTKVKMDLIMESIRNDLFFDINGSGKVNARDLLILYRYWNGGSELGLNLKLNNDCYPNKRRAADDNKILTEDTKSRMDAAIQLMKQ